MKRYGRPLKAMDDTMPIDQVIYFICYRHSIWRKLRPGDVSPKKRIWGFFTTEKGRNKALSKLLETGQAENIETGQFCLADQIPHVEEVLAREWREFTDKMHRVGQISVFEDDPTFEVVVDEPGVKVYVRSPSKVVLEAALRREGIENTVVDGPI